MSRYRLVPIIRWYSRARMNSIQNGRFYRRISTRDCFRILQVLPDRDIAIIARVDCVTTRARKESLSELNASLLDHEVIPVERAEDPLLPPEARSPATTAIFENLRPALEELMVRGYLALAEKSIWPEINRLSKKISVSRSTLNAAFSRVLMAGGVIDAAVPRYNKCGRTASTGVNDYIARPTRQPNSFPLQLRDLRNIATGVRKFLRGERTRDERTGGG